MAASIRTNTTRRQVLQVQGGNARHRKDALATEEPLEIRICPPGVRPRGDGTVAGAVSVSVTMRTPGSDFELAAGFLFTEGILQHRDQVDSISYCTDPDMAGGQQYNIVNVFLREGVSFDPDRLQRNFYTSSSCGVCGKASLEAVHVRGIRPILRSGFRVQAGVFSRLGDALREKQTVFGKTGGLHAAGLFDEHGQLLDIREDVGRHNATDKVVGAAFLAGQLPLARSILMVSGRTSFEIMQKAAAAGVPVVAAVSAPSSLACELARDFDITLVGFVRDDRFNVYAGEERIAFAQAIPS